MRYKLFGRSGLRVSEYCLGTMTFGSEWGMGAEESESRRIFDAYAEAGGNFLDTANVYSEGTSEMMLGKFIAADRDHFVVATKYTPSSMVKGDLSKTGNSRKNMMRSVEESLRRLGTDHIDLFFPHFWDFTTPLEEIMRGLDDLVRQGKILYVAASDIPAWQVSRGNMLADLRGWSPFIGLQIEYNLVERSPEREYLPMARELDLGIVAWSPLSMGKLTGKYRAANGVIEGRLASGNNYGPRGNAREDQIIEAVVEIARELGATPAQVALRWLRDRPGVEIIPILGARTHAQLTDNLGALTITLDAAQAAKLDIASEIEPGFPHALLASDMMRGLSTGGLYDQLDNHRSR